MESPCLEAEAKNHSTHNLRLLLRRSRNRLSYSRSTHLSGTPSNTTNVLLMPAESYKPIRRTRSARNGTARLGLASEKQSGTRACPTRTPPSHSYQVKAGLIPILASWRYNSVSIVSHGAAMPFFAFNHVGKPSAPFRGIHGVLLEAPESTAKPCLA